MKQVRKASQVFSLVLLIAVFSGCEAGLTSSNNSGSADSQGNGFSFSDMYSRMNSLEEEIKNLKQVNQQQQDLLQQDISALNQTAWEAGGNAGDISWNGGSVGINTANPAADLDVGGIFQVDTT
ncbi:MAG: hypothetical protein GY754_33155, partial [bacterium]|nr:hypothetical protein [bacterium]